MWWLCLLAPWPALGGAAGNAVAEESKVIAMNRFNFDDHLQRGPWMVKFFAPWCGHCQKMAPEWIKLAAASTATQLGLSVGEVDCTSNRALCEVHGIQGYPTVIYFAGGKSRPFSGGKMNSETFLAFAKENMKKDGGGLSTGPVFTFLRDAKQLLAVWPTGALFYNVHLGLWTVWIQVLVASGYYWLKNPQWHKRDNPF
jgi:protein disulfide-isomerase-like protein